MSPTELDIKTGTADSILAGLWRQVKKELDVDEVKLESLVDAYSTLLHPNNHEERVQTRGNLRSELAKETMTWKTFVKGLRVLRVELADIEFVLHHVTLVSKHRLLLELPTLQESTEPERNVLSEFFHNILNDLGVDLGKFDQLLVGYMHRSMIPITSKNRTHVRGNLKKELLGPKLTWRSLIKGFNFLCVVRLDIKPKLFIKNQVPSEHIRTVVLNDIEDFQDDLREDRGVI